MWSQIVGKIALSQAPPLNHSWSVALQLTSRGLMTRPLPHGHRTFTIEFDFLDHQLHIIVADGERRSLPLVAQTVASFYREVMTTLEEMKLPVRIWPVPVEIPNPIRFTDDTVHKSYDRDSVSAFYHSELGEFILPYGVVQSAQDPEAALLAFIDSTYSRAADLASWDRAALE